MTPLDSQLKKMRAAESLGRGLESGTTVRISSRQTDAAFCVVEMMTLPGEGVPRHCMTETKSSITSWKERTRWKHGMNGLEPKRVLWS
jgi:hypothetical protein